MGMQTHVSAPHFLTSKQQINILNNFYIFIPNDVLSWFNPTHHIILTQSPQLDRVTCRR